MTRAHQRQNGDVEIALEGDAVDGACPSSSTAWLTEALADIAVDGEQFERVHLAVGRELEAERARTLVRVDGVAATLARLRTVDDHETLMHIVPSALAKCGFDRVVVSSVSGSMSEVLAAHLPYAQREARALRLAGEQPLATDTYESEAIRRRSILSISPADPRRVAATLRNALQLEEYLVGPLLVGTRVIGLVHADGDGRPLTPEDQTLFGVFIECVAHAVQRVALNDRVDEFRKYVHGLGKTTADMVDQMAWSAIKLGPRARDEAIGGGAVPSPGRSNEDNSALAALTPRELEVLRLMAAGETNVAIASALFISPGTVKSHVKHILRKMQSANRSQAVARYMGVVHGVGSRRRSGPLD